LRFFLISLYCLRKGAGKEPLKQSESSKYPWKQLIVPIVAGHHNTPDGRKHVVSKEVERHYRNVIDMNATSFVLDMMTGRNKSIS
jgi:hypothetical protein